MQTANALAIDVMQAPLCAYLVRGWALAVARGSEPLSRDFIEVVRREAASPDGSVKRIHDEIMVRDELPLFPTDRHDAEAELLCGVLLAQCLAAVLECAGWLRAGDWERYQDSAMLGVCILREAQGLREGLMITREKKAALSRKGADARHKGNREKKALAQEWWAKNRDRVGSKNKAAEYLADKLGESFETVRNWLKEPKGRKKT